MVALTLSFTCRLKVNGGYRGFWNMKARYDGFQKGIFDDDIFCKKRVHVRVISLISLVCNGSNARLFRSMSTFFS